MYLTPTEISKRYGYHPKTLANWADEGKIKCIRSPGGHRRYPVAELEDFNLSIAVTKNRIKTVKIYSCSKEKKDIF